MPSFGGAMRVVWCLVLGCKGAPTVTQQAVDQDGDGYDANTDCDDSDPEVNPGAIDLDFDGFDRNCDGEEGGDIGIDRLPFYIEGRSGSDGFGGAFAACDLNDDGQADLAVSSYGLGRMHVFLGPLAAGTVVPSDADLTLNIPANGGYYVRCDDTDGDGRDDLLWTVPDGPLDPRYRIAVLRQPPGGFTGSEQPVHLDLRTTIESFWVEVVALDGPGSESLFLSVDPGAESTAAELYLVDGSALTADGVDVEHVGTPVLHDATRTYNPTVLRDLDGPGDDGVLVCGNVQPYCRVVSRFVDFDIATDVTTTFSSTTGGRAQVLDLDADGAVDDLVFARWQEPGDLKVVRDGLGQLEPAWTSSVTVPEGWSGRLEALDDLDGDGVQDLFLVTSNDTSVRARVLSGARLLDPPGARVQGVSLLSIGGPRGYVNRTTSGDLDGDGIRDPVFGIGGIENGALGGLGVLLSSSL